MYQPETILTKREPFDEDHSGAPYNRIKVVGQSPINHGGGATDWEGAQAQGVIVQPLEGFGATADEPYGKLVKLYEIESVPENVLPAEPQIRHIPQEGEPSPEDVFRETASEATVEEVPEPKKPVSPIDGEAPTAEELAEREAIKERTREQANNSN